MSTYRKLGEIVAEIALDLQEGLAEPPPRARKLEAACDYLMRAAELLLELDPSPELAAEVRALEALCLCGHDKGDHGVEAPHLCEGICPVPYGCPCPGYEHERAYLESPLPDLMATEPPGDMAATMPPEVA